MFHVYFCNASAQECIFNNHIMKQKLKAKILTGVLLLSLFSIGGEFAYAASPGSVVINEVAWAGSADSSSDEWIELYNPTSQPVDLSGWTLVDDGSTIIDLSGAIPAKGYYLIEDAETAVNPNAANLVAGLSLANAGDSLQIFDESANLIDSINSAGGAWYAGSSSTYASMERISPLSSGDDPANWLSSTGMGSTATASAGFLIIGTPGLLNSASASASSTYVEIVLSTDTPDIGEGLYAVINVTDIADLFAYGFEINYDPAILEFISVTEGGFLNENGSRSTSFQYGLEGGAEGNLLIAEALLDGGSVGVSGTGELFTVEFNVIGGEGVLNDISFGSGSFVSDAFADMPASFSGAVFTPLVLQADPVVNLQANEGSARYTIHLTWDTPASGATSFIVYRQDPHGIWVELGEVTGNEFTDSNNIIPNLQYQFSVVTVNGGVQSTSALTAGQDTRGIKGDNNRSDRVDGRDLQNLARHFTETDAGAGFDPLVDTTYDGQIDGSDLIDLGGVFASVYTP
jgi:hypothetical protein